MPHPPQFPFFILLFLTACDGNRSEYQAVGTLEWDRVELIAEVSESILELAAKEGEWVEAGRPLLQLDPARRLALLNQAQAARAQAAARLLELQRGPRGEDIEQAKARFAGAEQVLSARVREYERQAEILKRKLASPDAVDRARAERDAAQAERDTAEANLRELRAGTRKEQIEQARHALAEAEATVRRYEIDLAHLTVKAPVPGRVDSFPLQPGNQPQAGKVVATLLSGQPYARVYIPEPLRARVKPGDPARIHVDGLAQAFEGRVRMVEADPSFTPFYALTERDRKHLSYVAKIDFVGPSRDLPAGLPVQADLPESQASGADQP
ncbi:HlyD family secretion protein [Methylomagnum sp.]